MYYFVQECRLESFENSNLAESNVSLQSCFQASLCISVSAAAFNMPIHRCFSDPGAICLINPRHRSISLSK